VFNDIVEGSIPFNVVTVNSPGNVALSSKIVNWVHTHTQCVFHIIRLRLIIFHTPKNFHGRNKIE